MQSSYPRKTVTKYVTAQIYVLENFNILKCKCYYHFKMPSVLFDLWVYYTTRENLQSKSLVHIVPLSPFKGCYISFVEFFGLFFNDFLLAWYCPFVSQLDIIFDRSLYFQILTYNDWNVFVKGMKRGHISSSVDNIASLSISFVPLSSIKLGIKVHQNKSINTIFEGKLSAWIFTFIMKLASTFTFIYKVV